MHDDHLWEQDLQNALELLSTYLVGLRQGMERWYDDMALATQLTDTTAMLERLQPQLADIEGAHDSTAMRQIVTMLVQRIVVETTEEEGKKHATVTITYRLAEQVVAESSDRRTRRHASREYW